MLWLIFHYYHGTKSCQRKKIGYVFFGSLLFALLGDIFLLNNELFVFGLASFLLMQVGYCVVFSAAKNFFGTREWIFGAILLLIVVAMVMFLWPHTGSLRLPVGIYASVIGLMAFLAYTRDMRSPGYSRVVSGAILFLISDMILSINHFVPEYTVHGSIVMLTYAAAQLLIVSGWIDFTCKD